jgi:uncharacterized protein with ParB-like and HNH nuclease domain/predicted transport protein
MKATEARLLDFLRRSPQMVIPIYQRTYSWTARECRQLWDDIIRAGTDERVAVHFLGSIVYIEADDWQVTYQPPLLVIDGQQRLTTVTLLLTALARAVGDAEPADGFSAERIRGYYLMNPLERSDRRFKLLLSQTDRDTLTALVGGLEPPREPSMRVMENFAFFEELLASRPEGLAAVCKGLAKLVVVDISLRRGQDNPQLIFESMNSTGKELSQADLIRNYVLMGLEPELQSRLYQQYWHPMETEFGQEAYVTHFDPFMRHYLTVKTGEIPRLADVYEAFKAHARSADVAAAGVEALVADIRTHARSYCCMALGAEPGPSLRAAFQDLRELRVDVAYPFLLELYQDYRSGALSAADFLTIVRLIESYVFRRAICAVPTNSMNKTFAHFHRAVKKDRYLESVQAHFLSLPSYRRFPGDEEFRRDLRTRDLYNFRSRTYFLRRLENHGRRERVPVDELTIEHILPQNENLSPRWREALGPDWKQVQRRWLHTLGNLTLTAYNAEFSDRPFAEKRDMPSAPDKGLRNSPLRLNQGLGALESWGEAEIQARAARLADLALTVWPAPSLPADVLAGYQRTAESQARYTINDHPNLLTPAMRLLFEAFRKEVLALDPCVTEEYLKHYVAYKAETNFVDVVPQAKRLRLSLNMRFSDVNDPRGVCKDVSGVGRWGNGDVEVGLSTLAEMPYVLGLVRQALDRQMGGAEE